MLVADTHTHSICSPDGRYPISELARAAAKAGLNVLCVTDHCDLVDGAGSLTLSGHSWRPYQAQFRDALAVCPPGLELRRGVELGEAYEDPEVARGILAEEPELDFVLGSVHNGSARLNRLDFYVADYPTLDVCREVLDDYLTSLEALVDLPDCYDSLAHILYPVRYMAQAGHRISLTGPEHLPRLEGILRRVAQAGKAMEVNTWRGRTVAEWAPLLRLFKAVGGVYVTVGSDSHTTGELGYGVRESYEVLKACGFDRAAVYRRRTPELIAI